MATEPKPPQTARARPRTSRHDRLADALRANLARRKAQARGRRAAEDAPPGAPKPGPEPGPDPEIE